MMYALAAIGIFLLQEIVATLVYWLANRFILQPADKQGWGVTSVLMGVFERLVLYIALLTGYPQMLIAFGALKLGTRLSGDKECKISNAYFLLGNLGSILLAICGTEAARHAWRAMGQ